MSLRLVSDLIRICKNVPYTGEPEDVYFANNVDIDKIPPPGLASHFSIEMTPWYEKNDPDALHKPWPFYSTETLCKLLENLPGRCDTGQGPGWR